MKWRENFSGADSYGLGDHQRGFHGGSGRTDHADTAAVFRPDQKLYFEYITSDKTEALYLHEKGNGTCSAVITYIMKEMNACKTTWFPCGQENVIRRK